MAGTRTPAALAGDLWLIESEGRPADHFEKMLAHVASAKAKDCLALVRQTVDPDKMVIVVVGDAAKLKADLETIAPVSVVAAKSTQGDAASTKTN